MNASGKKGERLRCAFCERFHDWPKDKTAGRIPCECGAVCELFGAVDIYAVRPQDIPPPEEIGDDLAWRCVNVPELHYIETADGRVAAYLVDWLAPPGRCTAPSRAPSSP